jgi:hypothetical protein
MKSPQVGLLHKIQWKKATLGSSFDIWILPADQRGLDMESGKSS